jgi:hypothetical protein
MASDGGVGWPTRTPSSAATARPAPGDPVVPLSPGVSTGVRTRRAPGSDRNCRGGGSRTASPSIPTSINEPPESTTNCGAVPFPAAESADAVKAVGVVGDEHDGRPAVDVPVVSGEARVDPPAFGAEQVGEQSRGGGELGVAVLVGLHDGGIGAGADGSCAGEARGTAERHPARRRGSRHQSDEQHEPSDEPDTSRTTTMTATAHPATTVATTRRAARCTSAVHAAITAPTVRSRTASMRAGSRKRPTTTAARSAQRAPAAASRWRDARRGDLFRLPG